MRRPPTVLHRFRTFTMGTAALRTVMQAHDVIIIAAIVRHPHPMGESGVRAGAVPMGVRR